MKYRLLFLGFVASVSLHLDVQGMFLESNSDGLGGVPKSSSVPIFPRANTPIDLPVQQAALVVNKVVLLTLKQFIEKFIKNIGKLYIFLRHIADANNSANISHPNQDDGHPKFSTSPENMSLVLILKNIGSIRGIRIVSSHQTRSFVTSKIMCNEDEGKVLTSDCFGEQQLGCLSCKDETAIMRDPSFINMITDPNFKIDKDSETGYNVMDRSSAGMEQLREMGNEPCIIVGSRCFMNWTIRLTMKNLELPPLDIQNGNAFLYIHDSKTGTNYILSDGNGSPMLLSPYGLLNFILSNPKYASNIHKEFNNVVIDAVLTKKKSNGFKLFQSQE